MKRTLQIQPPAKPAAASTPQVRVVEVHGPDGRLTVEVVRAAA